MPYPKHEYSPAEAADIRHRVEHTNESIQSIADRCGVNRSTLYRHIREQGLTRQRRRKREVPVDDLLESLEEELRAVAADKVAEQRPAPQAAPAAAGAAAKPSRAERMERLLDEHLSSVEEMRLRETPRSVTAAERTTRMLERMTEALFKVRRLRASEPAPKAPEDYDDWPVDIDAFRNELARRIEVFVRSETGAAVSEQEPESGTAPEA